jgi:uncharacterized protein (DUF3084 family)
MREFLADLLGDDMKMGAGIVGFVLLAVLGAACARADPEPANPGPTTDPIRARQVELFDKAEKDQAETHKINMEYYDRAEKVLQRAEALAARQEADSTRFEKILDTWERQQAEYQKYLDSLPKK